MIRYSFLYNIFCTGLFLFIQCCNVQAAASRQIKMGDKQEAKTVEIVDVASVTTDNPSQAVKTIQLDIPEKTINCDIFIAGGGLGGVAAALKIWQLQQETPLHIVLSEETNW